MRAFVLVLTLLLVAGSPSIAGVATLADHRAQTCDLGTEARSPSTAVFAGSILP